MDIFNKINMRGNKIDNCPDTDINNKEIEFQEAKNRENIKSNEKVPIIFGKIAKWLTDLGNHLKDEVVHVSNKEREKWNEATQVTITQNLTTGTKVGTICIDGTEYDLYCQTNTDHDTWKANTRDQEGYVAKGSGQANRVWKTDANGNPGWREDANTQAVKSVNDKTGDVTLTAADVKAIPTSDKIDKLTNIRQITRLGYWAISAIDNTYAASIGVDNNTGDFHALVLSYNGNGTDKYNFGTIILSSPRLGAYHYVIQVWEGTAHAERMLNFADVTNSTAVNIAGKKALDAIEKNPSVAGTLANQLQQVNSNLTWRKIDISSWLLLEGFEIRIAEHCPALRMIHFYLARPEGLEGIANTSYILNIPTEFKPVNSAYIGFGFVRLKPNSTTIYEEHISYPFNLILEGSKLRMYYSINATGYAHKIDITYTY